MGAVLGRMLGRNPAAERARLSGLRAALISSLAVAFVAGLASPADAYYPRRFPYASSYSGWYGGYTSRRIRHASPSHRERSEPRKEPPAFRVVPSFPLQLVVNISTQKVTLYSNGTRVAQGPVSTGMPGHPTPMGVFSIIEKDRYHHSNIYSGAPMPFMQRITWSGVAIHEGVLPGHPASHGCIRTSHDFAQKLWPVTKLGVRFIVARGEIVPVDFEHPKLFVPKPKPPEARIAMNGQTDGRAGRSEFRSRRRRRRKWRRLRPASCASPSRSRMVRSRRRSRSPPAPSTETTAEEGSAKPEPTSIRQADCAARKSRRSPSSARAGRGVREPQREEDLRASGDGAHVRHAHLD